MKKALLVLLAILLVLPTLAACGARKAADVHVFYYTYSDPYISTVRSSLDGFLRSENVSFQDYDSNNSQTTQTEQVQTAITKGAKLLVVNVVTTGSDDAASGIVALAKKADIPVVFFNREVSDAAVKTSDNICFVGTDPDAPGYMQGEQVAELLSTNEAFQKYDLNGDGKIQYAMFRAEVGNAEADGRTKYAVERANTLLAENGAILSANKDGDVLVRVGADQLANWDSATANNMMGSLFRVQNGVPNIELVLCNNDDMALGVISALQAKGYNKQGSREGGAYIPVFGVDALATAMDAIENGQMQGTVKQDGDAMAKAIVTIAANIMEGKAQLWGTDYVFESGVRKLRIAYSPINAE